MKKEELIVGERYWFCDTRNTDLVPLNLMNKIEGRRAYRFVAPNRKTIYLLHERKLDNMFVTYREACLHMAYVLRNMAASYERRAEPQPEAFNPPNPRDWQIARGFPLPVKFGRK